ncbi:MAG: hypothetical protein FRX49_04766 [Trebouxia sp. A1-2]|nr:MAG: hypothetical protein FRX49_04766 [Trebouxia sp. A1-2]
MAAHNLRVREQHRELLRGAGFPFCDDHAQEPDSTLRQAQQTLAEHHTAPSQDLICQGVSNSSCDHDLHQNISSSPRHEEHLTYRLASPQCAVLAVQIAVYRARYQLGAPLYPPKTVRFEIGFSKNRLQPVPAIYQVQLTDSIQTFLLPASSPIGHFLKVVMHGKVQQQFEDRQYFTAIRRVQALGRCIMSEQIFQAHQLIQSKHLCLSQLFTMPATTEQHVLELNSHTRDVQSCAAEHSHAAKEVDSSCVDSIQAAQTSHQYTSFAAAHAAAFEPGRQIKDCDCAAVQGINSDLSELLYVCDRSSGVLFCDQTHES